MKTFILCTEEEPKLELPVPCEQDAVPQLVHVLPRDELFVKIGRYLTTGDRYRFQRVTPFSVIVKE
jgi:hypothetical protein